MDIVLWQNFVFEGKHGSVLQVLREVPISLSLLSFFQSSSVLLGFSIYQLLADREQAFFPLDYCSVSKRVTRCRFPSMAVAVHLPDSFRSCASSAIKYFIFVLSQGECCAFQTMKWRRIERRNKESGDLYRSQLTVNFLTDCKNPPRMTPKQILASFFVALQPTDTSCRGQ